MHCGINVFVLVLVGPPMVLICYLVNTVVLRVSGMHSMLMGLNHDYSPLVLLLSGVCVSWHVCKQQTLIIEFGPTCSNSPGSK